MPVVRNMIAFGLLAGLTGCGLPPVVTAFSYAVEGVSFATSGKGISGHALSAAVDKDCALFRIVKGEEVCRAHELEESGTVLAMADDGSESASVETGGNDKAPDLYSYGIPGDTGWQIEARPALAIELRPENVDEESVIRSGQPPVTFDISGTHPNTASFSDFSFTTEVYAILQDDGALELFAYETSPHSASDQLRLVATYPGFRRNPDMLTGIRIHEAYYSISELMV